MTTPAPPALEPCPECSRGKTETGLVCSWCDKIVTSPVPSPPAEVARLSELLIEWIDRATDAGRHSDAALFDDVQKCLLSQASALAAAGERADGNWKKYNDTREVSFRIARARDLAERVLTEVFGCRKTEQGWERPVRCERCRGDGTMTGCSGSGPCGLCDGKKVTYEVIP